MTARETISRPDRPAATRKGLVEMTSTPSTAEMRSHLTVMVAESVEAALSDPGTLAQLRAAGISVADARTYLQERTVRVMAAEARL